MTKHLLKAADVVMVNLGQIQEVVGHEQALHRPCIVIKPFNNLQLVLVLPVTSKGSAHFTVVKIEKSDGGLAHDSYALCHQLRTISSDRITKSIGTLSPLTFNKIRGVLRDLLDL